MQNAFGGSVNWGQLPAYWIGSSPAASSARSLRK